MECCRGGLLPRSTGLPDLVPDGEEDRISPLPDDMLLQILVRLGCARAAAHTGLLVRRWRGLWARLHKLTFHRISPDPLDAALAMVARLAPSLLDIHFFHHHMLEPARLDLYYVGFTLPPAGGFPALESLHMENCHIDITDMLPRCPLLKKLWELAVYANRQIRHINIVAPALKKLYLDAHCGIHKKFTLSFSAPAVEDLTLKRECRAISYRFGVIWRMWSLTFSTCLQPLGHTQLANNSESMYLYPLHRPRGVLSLNLETNVLSGDAAMTFEQGIYRFQVTDFSVLELDVTQSGHVYGAIVLHLLGLCTSIQRLKVTLVQRSDIYIIMRVHCS
uniref:F-box domain-containing protein n=1 Tax=Setaria italica TaxID=4555 RepID=K3YL08_SETIT